jgi:hypothetical protein
MHTILCAQAVRRARQCCLNLSVCRPTQVTVILHTVCMSYSAVVGNALSAYVSTMPRVHGQRSHTCRSTAPGHNLSPGMDNFRENYFVPTRVALVT